MRTQILVTLTVVGMGLVPVMITPAGGRSWNQPPEKKVRESNKLLVLGEGTYRAACLFCHGEKGDGQGVGEAVLWVKPRAFVDGKFKIRSTSSGSMPTDEDLFRSISAGFPAYGMPSFRHLSARERWALVYYIKTFSPRFQEDTEDPLVELGSSPPVTRSTRAQGEQVFATMRCAACHGEEGRGDGPSASTLVDDDGRPNRILDFTQGHQVFKRGATARDIAYTFMTGLNGTPMPAYNESMTREEIWALSYFIESLALQEEERRSPR